MSDVLVAILAFAGALLMLLAAIGVTRMPDLFTRMQTTTKAASLGVGLVLIAAAIHFGEFGVAARALAAVVFILVTAPIAAHLLGRAAYFLGLHVYCPTGVDELRARYDEVTHELESLRPAGIPEQPRSDLHEGSEI